MTVSGSALPAAAYIATLAALPEVGPARLAALLRLGPPDATLAALSSGRLAADAGLVAAIGRADPTPLLRAWREAAAGSDPAALWRAHRAAGVEVLTPADERWPLTLAGDPDPPAVLFVAGDAGLLRDPAPSVAVVGSRRCTRYGWDTAHRLGRELTAAGVAVVSGLARGIDAAAHRGALDGLDALAGGAAAGGRPIGVVGTGLDVVYPRDSSALWREVAARGVLVSEAPLGTPPARWRFPARNRVIAALAVAVVVVESAPTGGAMHTVDEALARDRPVLAVPGPVTSPVSAGTNRLLCDVAAPACDTDDVLAAIGLPPRAARPPSAPPAVDPADAGVLHAVGFTPTSLDAVAIGAGVGLGVAAAALARLEAGGLVHAAGAAAWIRADGAREVTR